MGYLPFPPSMLLGYSGLLPLSIQAALLHPYFEPSPNFRLIRAALMPLVIYITVASVPIRTLKPAEAFLHLNFPLISIPSFHIVCLAIIFAFHEGNAFKSKGTLESQVARAGSIPHRDTAPRELQETKSTTQPKTSSRREGKDSLEAHRDRKVAVKPPSIGELVKFVTALIFRCASVRPCYRCKINRSYCHPSPQTLDKCYVSFCIIATSSALGDYSVLGHHQNMLSPCENQYQSRVLWEKRW